MVHQKPLPAMASGKLSQRAMAEADADSRTAAMADDEPPPLSLAAGLRGAAGATAVFCLCVAAGGAAAAAQAASALLLRPLAPTAHRRLSVAANSAFFRVGVLLLEKWNGMRIVVYGEPVAPDVPVVCVMNHISDVDMLVGLALLTRYGPPFPGNAKAIVKSALARVPIFGWVLYFGEFLFVTRSWEADEARLSADLRSLLSYPVPVWFVLWPEGSRATPEKLATSQAYAARTGRPTLAHVLLPRFKAFLSVMREVRADVTDMCDVTLMFEGPVPRAPHVLAGTCNTVVHAHLRRHNLADLPAADAPLEDWLVARWQEKDSRIDAFKRLGPASLGPPLEDGPLGNRRAPPGVAPFIALATVGVTLAAGALWAASDNALVFRILVAGPPVLLLFAGLFLAAVARPSSKGLSADQKKGRSSLLSKTE